MAIDIRGAVTGASTVIEGDGTGGIHFRINGARIGRYSKGRSVATPPSSIPWLAMGSWMLCIGPSLRRLLQPAAEGAGGQALAGALAPAE